MPFAESARRSKKAGNEAFQRKDYQEAVRMYCQARCHTLSGLSRPTSPQRMCCLGSRPGREHGGCVASCGTARRERTL
jgi:hypothetical protein